MATALGLIGMAVFIACVISLAAGVTYAVVRLTPSEKKKPPANADEVGSS